VRVVHVHRIGGIGGSERHLLALLPALAQLGVEASFVGLDFGGDRADPFYAELEAAGIPFERLPCPSDLHPSLPRAIARAARRRDADILHTHLVHADVYGSLVRGVALVSTKHNPDPFRTGLFRFVERAIARRAARAIAISDAVRRFSVEEVGLPAATIDVVHYGLDGLPRPWGPNPVLPIRDDARILLAVGRLAAQKGIDTAVRALAHVRAAHPDAILLVLGEGPERRRLEGLAHDLGVSNAVVMPGRVGDVAELYRRAELLIHPARWEGFGLALLEAMLAGKPVVACRAGSAPELVEEGRTGLLVQTDDADALARAVVRLLDDHGLASTYGAAGLERARREFSVDRMAKRTAAIYEEVLSPA
jgi:glycosyltransferase involved in cell wall biosynthesis